MEITVILFLFYKSLGFENSDLRGAMATVPCHLKFYITTRKMQFMHIYFFAKLWKLELRMTLS